MSVEGSVTWEDVLTVLMMYRLIDLTLDVAPTLSVFDAHALEHHIRDNLVSLSLPPLSLPLTLITLFPTPDDTEEGSPRSQSPHRSSGDRWRVVRAV